MNGFDQLNLIIRNSEASLVNLLSALAPWAAPLAPAYMTFSHLVSGGFGFPAYIAWAVAMVVEVLGLSSISTILAFWSYNRRFKDDTRKAPVWLAVLSFIIYLAVILLVNVALDAANILATPESQAWIKVGAKALLTLLSVPAAVILATRTQHKEMLDTVERDRERRREEKRALLREPVYRGVVHNNGNDSGSISSKRKQFLLDVRSGELNRRLEEMEVPLSPLALMDIYGVSQRTAYRMLDVLNRVQQ